MSIRLDEILDCERAVWSALVVGDAAADARLLADDFLGVYSTGFAAKTDHVGQLSSGPTIASFELSEARLMHLGPDTELLSYRADYVQAPLVPAGPVETMFVTSIWRRDPDGWVNVFSQDTQGQV